MECFLIIDFQFVGMNHITKFSSAIVFLVSTTVNNNAMVSNVAYYNDNPI